MGDDFPNYLMILITDQDKSNRIWDDKLNHYLKQAKVLIETIKKNQHQTKHYSLTTREWYGSSYKTFEIGLQQDRFVEFYKCYDNLPPDIFKLLCQYWFEAEVLDAKQRLQQYDIFKAFY